MARIMIILALIILSISINSYSQDRYVDPGIMEFENIALVDSLVNEYNKAGGDTVLIFLTSTDYINEVQSIFIFHKMDGKVTVRLIKQNNIYSILEIPKSQIFSFKKIEESGVTKDERTLYFAPDYLEGINTNALIFLSKKSRLYFEFGRSAITYYQDKKSNKYKTRSEWITIIKNELFPLIESFKKID